MAEYGGLRPWGPPLRVTPYPVVTAYATALYKGDPVARVADGTVALAADGAVWTGAIVGFLDTDKNPINYHVALAAGDGVYACWALVADHPDQMFVIGEDLVTDALAAIDAGSNIDLINGTGNAATGCSGCLLDSNTHAVTITLQCHLIRLAPINGNAIGNTAPSPQWLVTPNAHQLGVDHVGI